MAELSYTEQKINKDVGKELSGSLAKVYKIIRKSPKTITPEMARIAGRSERTIERTLAKLKEKKLVKRVGGRREGRWEAADR